MKVLYRISDNSYVKPRMENATKQRCLINFLYQWGNQDEITVYRDKCKPETMEFLDSLRETVGLQVVDIEGGSSAGSWRVVQNEALKFNDNEVVYFVEDDYFHLPHSRQILLEGIERADYVTLYDHVDKYIPAQRGGNPYISMEGGEQTIVILTRSSHWKLTNSTTMTFATRVATLREDLEVWNKWTTGTHPNDFQAFIELRSSGRSLISPIPSLSTHCEPAWAAPLIDWTSI